MLENRSPCCRDASPEPLFAPLETVRKNRKPRFFLALLPGYSALSLTSFIETLAIANEVAGQELLTWRTCSIDGRAVPSSSGLSLDVDQSFEDLNFTDVVLVCAGRGIQKFPTLPLIRWLRKCARHGVRIGGLECGSEILAEAGLLNGKNTTLHWRQHTSFQERFPQIGLSKSSIVFEGNSFSSSGGTSAIDLALCFVETHASPLLAQQVADELCYSQQRKLHELTPDTNPVFANLGHPKLRQIIREMDERMEDAPPMEYFAGLVGFSQRQMERLFLRHLGMSPKRYFNNMRLDRARSLLMQTDMSTTEVCIATGFTSPGFFSRKFGARFGVTPHQFRNERP